MKETARNVSQ